MTQLNPIAAMKADARACNARLNLEQRQTHTPEYTDTVKQRALAAMTDTPKTAQQIREEISALEQGVQAALRALVKAGLIDRGEDTKNTRGHPVRTYRRVKG